MKKILLTIVLLAGFLYPQDYVLKDSSQTAMSTLRALADSISYKITDLSNTKVSYTEFNAFKLQMADSIAKLNARIDYFHTPFVPVDSIPNSFAFTPVTNAELSTVYTSNIIIVSGVDSAYAYAGGAEFQINSGSWVTAYTRVFNGNTIKVRKTSSNSYSTAVTATLTIGGVSAVYTITTKADVSTYVESGHFISPNGSNTSPYDTWAKACTNPNSSAFWNAVSAGDTVWIDGGASGDSITYSTIPFTPTKAGSVGNKIKITRGKSSSHSGKPIFLGTNTTGAAEFTVDNLEISYITFKHGYTGGGQAVYLGADNIDLLHCEIVHPRTIGITVQGNDCRVMYNQVFTGIVSNGYPTDGMWIGGGADSPSDVGGGIYGGLEVAYNYFLMQNSSGSGHKDAMQCTMRWQNDTKLNTTTKIHHNFFGALPQSPSTNADLIYVDDGAAGHYEVYDNIFVQKNFTDNGYVNFFGDQQKDGMWVKCYNNTMYNTTSENVSYKFYDIDSLDFRNNIIYTNSAWAIVGIDWYTENEGSYFNWDYNQYQGTQASFSYMYEQWENHTIGSSDMFTWTTFKSTFGADAHSEFGTLGFAGGTDTNPNYYKLNAGATGVDEGTTISTVTDDYSGTSRPQGSAYDVGAFER